jgi:hypothetical protein
LTEKIDAVMPEIVGVMKGMLDLLEKQDATQERAKLDKPPKTGEGMKPIVGGTSPNGKPGEGFAKEFPPIPRTSSGSGSEEIDSEGGSLLKEDENAEDETAYTPEESAEEGESGEGEGSGGNEEEDEVTEVKSLLKSISAELTNMKKSQPVYTKADMQKMVREEARHMLRKMGFTPSMPDVTRFGIDQTSDVKKAEITDVKKSEEADLGSLSWRQLGQIRAEMGGFNNFYK